MPFVQHFLNCEELSQQPLELIETPVSRSQVTLQQQLAQGV